MKRIPVLLITYLFLTPTISSVYAADSITLCVKESGVVFAIGAGFHTTECKKNDKLVTLTYGGSGGVGATGATGNIGSTGATGQQGVQGIPGEFGPTGATGSKGDIGPTGEIGPVGATGLAGTIGATGFAGSTGATGVQGIEGPVGATGPSGEGSTGATGSQGPTGEVGPVGATGANGVTGYELITVTNSTTDDPKTVTVDCPSGKKAVGGGFTSSTQSVQVFETGPTNDGSSWLVTLNKTTASSAWDMTVTVICVTTL